MSQQIRDELGDRSVSPDALRNLLAAWSTAPRLAFVSSTSVDGDLDGAWVDEATPCRPSASNGRILLAAEDLARSSGRSVLLLLRLGGS